LSKKSRPDEPTQEPKVNDERQAFETLAFAVSVLDDVMGDITDWEDKSLFDACYEAKRRLLAARAASPVPAGWKLVPVEPTKEMLAAGDKIMDCDPQWVARGYRAMLAASPASPAAVEMSPEFTDTSRAALAWVLWHHQGASSEIGQAMRFALGMGRTERLSERQVAEAKRWAAIAAQPPTPQPPQGAQQEPVATK
jgi:hypothetical protein